jgi:hypothetical protein
LTVAFTAVSGGGATENSQQYPAMHTAICITLGEAFNRFSSSINVYTFILLE